THVHLDAEGDYGSDQVSFFLGRNYVVSIAQGPHDLFEPVRERIRGGGKIRRYGADYLLYSLLDVVVDSAFALLEELGDRLEALEDEILDDPTREARNRIHYAKRELVVMRRAWWPQREVVAALMRDEDRQLSDHTRLYLRDCYDHCVIVIDFVETYREMASSLLDTYLSAVSQRMNDVMKALTVAATIFLPLTFITGLYGMNFDTASPWNLPELHWRFGYPYALGLMVAIVAGMLAYFKHRRWL
ncbi:MAG TPA: magnesium/cobalt transporter CorA, partial [Rubrivivax sp.]|nr:magnesium/cobalt transporter CorA [Rubrivivax sp.]